ncbi:MAG: hypothetical protein NC039_00230 [Muribaculaceae bacterium]|nr:hypothetical protein [Muribaculaceae bacterium]
MEEETITNTIRPADSPAAPQPEPSTPDVPGPELGFMELFRAPADGADTDPDPTERVLSRHRPSAWDF